MRDILIQQLQYLKTEISGAESQLAQFTGDFKWLFAGHIEYRKISEYLRQCRIAFRGIKITLKKYEGKSIPKYKFTEICKFLDKLKKNVSVEAKKYYNSA